MQTQPWSQNKGKRKEKKKIQAIMKPSNRVTLSFCLRAYEGGGWPIPFTNSGKQMEMHDEIFTDYLMAFPQITT